jgi:hypothetical protein
MRYIKPQINPPSPLILAPVLGASVWQVILAGSGFPHVANPPNTLAKALAWVGGDVRGEVWFGSFIQRMISPNLLAIWPFLFLNLSQDLIVLLLRYFGTLGEG